MFRASRTNARRNCDRVSRDEVRITYREFDAYSNQLANLLIARGVAKGDLVGVLMDRSIEMMIGLYAVLKAGAAYVPMRIPPIRCTASRLMAEDAEPKIILTETERAAQLAAFKRKSSSSIRKTIAVRLIQYEFLLSVSDSIPTIRPMSSTRPDRRAGPKA